MRPPLRPSAPIGPPNPRRPPTPRAEARRRRPAAAAAQAEADGRLVDAVDLLRLAIRDDPDARSRRSRRTSSALRHLAFDEVAVGTGREQWPPTYADLPPTAPGTATRRSGPARPEVLGSALVNHGALHVEGLLTPDQVATVVEGIDRAFEGRDGGARTRRRTPRPWFVPVRARRPPTCTQMLPRDWVREGGGVWAADSPRVFARDARGLRRPRPRPGASAATWASGPAISMRKCTLRRVPADLAHADWHQDGAFLGDDVRSVNVWLALTRCGGDSDAPGLEYVPRRIDHVARDRHARARPSTGRSARRSSTEIAGDDRHADRAPAVRGRRRAALRRRLPAPHRGGARSDGPIATRSSRGSSRRRRIRATRSRSSSDRGPPLDERRSHRRPSGRARRFLAARRAGAARRCDGRCSPTPASPRSVAASRSRPRPGARWRWRGGPARRRQRRLPRPGALPGQGQPPGPRRPGAARGSCTAWP